MQGTVVIGKPNCPYCDMAKKVLTKKGIEFTYIDILAEGKSAAELTGRPDVRTVPQIFLNGEYIGGYTELAKKLVG